MLTLESILGIFSRNLATTISVRARFIGDLFLSTSLKPKFAAQAVGRGSV